jgi:hypothetical protein
MLVFERTTTQANTKESYLQERVETDIHRKRNINKKNHPVLKRIPKAFLRFDWTTGLVRFCLSSSLIERKVRCPYKYARQWAVGAVNGWDFTTLVRGSLSLDNTGDVEAV